MCVGRHVSRSGAGPASSLGQRTTNPAHTDVTSATRTRTFRQLMKPALPRKLTSSARINLNQYWNILQELVPCDVTMGIHDDGVDMSNEINENLANERLEQSRDLPPTCRGSSDNSDVEIVVSLDNRTLWENSASCITTWPQEIRDST